MQPRHWKGSYAALRNTRPPTVHLPWQGLVVKDKVKHAGMLHGGGCDVRLL